MIRAENSEFTTAVVAATVGCAGRYHPDRVPDFLLVLGYADDAIVAAIALRRVVRIAGSEAIDRHWTGRRKRAVPWFASSPDWTRMVGPART